MGMKKIISLQKLFSIPIPPFVDLCGMITNIPAYIPCDSLINFNFARAISNLLNYYLCNYIIIF